MILESKWTLSSAMQLFTDASGSKGWGALSNHWLQSEWSPEQSAQDIVWKELYAIVSAMNTWGHLWSKRKILFHCDNNIVVDIWQKGLLTHCKEIMALIRLLYVCAARHNIHIMITHIAGINNNIADAISRFQMEHFRTLAPAVNLQPDPICALPTLTSANCETNASP